VANWLTGRRQRVALGGELSDWIAVLSGVPQGSVLGPLLFLIFINDIDDAAAVVEVIRKFADDTKVGQTIRSEDDRKLLQGALDKLTEWSEKWGMSFNVKKCKVVHSVEDPDPGSEIRCLFTPRIRDPDPGSGMIFFPDPGSRIPDPYHVPNSRLYL
jgi:Reverse transcriptase (RNA-dependent DNA polymerase)